MNNFTSRRLAFILVVVSIAFLASCGGLGPHSMPAPTPVLNPHGTFVFVSGFTSGPTTLTDGYRLNPDGSLTAIPGSPFPISGQLAASGSFLMSVNEASLTSYRVDPATGVPTSAASAAVPQFVDTVGGDPRNVYVAGASADIGDFIYGFSVADSGTLAPVPGSPYISGGPCDECPMPIFPNLALNNNFFALSVEGYRGTGGISIYRRDSNGSLNPGGFTGFEGQSAAALQPSAGNLAFSLVSGIVTSYHLDPEGTPTQAMALETASFTAQDEAVDATGKFLLVMDDSGAVHVFAIDSATAAFSQIGSSEPAGDGSSFMVMDPNGRFVIVAQSSEGGFLSTPDRITVFSFDPASGAIKKLESYPIDKSPFTIAIVAE